MNTHKTTQSFTDDAGQVWEFEWREDFDEGAFGDFRYRTPGREWMTLPSWADVADEWKITLGLFDEDDDGDMTFWKVVPS